MGHGSELIWNVQATGVVISWIPLMIFAFLYGISMDYEVFMITRIRESYDETGDTSEAISLGLARTGKLVTSGAGVLMFAFFALSTGPGLDIKLFGIGLAAGVIIDATLIRLLLVPRRCSCSAAGTGGCRPGWRRCCARPRARSSRARRRRSRRPTRERPATGRGPAQARTARGSAASCLHTAATSLPRVRRTVAEDRRPSLHAPARRPCVAVQRRARAS